MNVTLRRTLPFLLAITTLASTAQAASFTTGNLAVFQADSSSVNNTTFSIVELNTNTGFVQTIGINDTNGVTALRTSGSASTTGYLSDSDDGTLLVFSGHNSTTSSGNANTILARGVGTLDNAGSFTLQATYTGTSGNQTRGATSTNNSKWVIGDQGGIYTNGATAGGPAGNFRAVKSFGGVVYVQQASAGTIVVNTVSSGTVTGLPGLTLDSSATDFYLISSGNNGATFDVLYTIGGDAIKKYSLVSGTWTANGTYATQTGFALCAAKSGSGAVLYVTTGTGATTGNSVVKLLDTAGYNSTIAITTGNNVTLYTAANGTTLKGIAFAPKPACIAPTITGQPVDATICAGSPTNFTVTATGTSLSYQWRLNGVNLSNGGSIAGATTATLSVTPTSASDTVAAGSGYDCVITESNNGPCASTSNRRALTVNAIPDTPTAAVASNIGTTLFTANWNASANATGYRLDVATDAGFTAFVTGFNDLAAGNGTTNLVTGLSAATAYYYRVRAYNGCGTSGNSETITVTTAAGCVAATAATPVASPSATVCFDTPVTLTETPSAGTAPFNFQWRKDGEIIPGATAASLLITNEPGDYTCDVTAQCGGSTSISPQLTVTVNARPTIALGGNPTVCAGATNVSLSYSGTTGTPDLYSVTWDFTNISDASLPASPLTLNIPVGAAAGTYTGVLTVKQNATGCVSTNYAFAVTLNANPIIAEQPNDDRVVLGVTGKFSVKSAATGYQWQVNTGSGFNNITGGTSDEFTTDAAIAGMDGYQYRCLVSDGITGCQTISATGTLRVTLPFGVGNLMVFSADNAAVNNTTFSIIEINTNTANQSATQTIRIKSTGNNALRTSGSATSTGYLSDSDDGTLLVFTAHNSTNATGNANTITKRGVGTLDNAGRFDVPTTYTGSSGNQTRGAVTLDNATWFIGDQGGIFTNSSAVLTNVNVRSVKSFGGTVYVMQQSTSTVATVVSSVASNGALTGLSGLPNDSAAFDFAMISSGNNGAEFDVLYVLENIGATLGAVQKYSLVGGTWADSGIGIIGTGGYGLCAKRSGSGAALYLTTGAGNSATNSVVKFTDAAGYNDEITINPGDMVTLFTATPSNTLKGIAFAPVPSCVPTIITDPTPQILTDGAVASFAVSATGSNLTYQWQRNRIDVSDGGTIAGATSTNLTLTGVALADSDSRWRCVVFADGVCSNISKMARLVVNSTAPVVAFTPSNLVVEIVGDGGNDLSAAAFPIRLVEMTTAGAVAQTLILPSAGPTPTTTPFNCVESGTASSDGNLTLSTDGRWLVVPGYNGVTGEANITSSSQLRTLGLVGGDGTTNTPHGLNIGLGANFRGAATTDGTNFWLAGQNGLTYFNGTLGLTNLLSTNNCRTVKIFSNQLYVVSGSGSPGRGIFAIGSGLPTSGTPVWNLVITNGTQSASPFNFEFNPTTNICYLADDGAPTNFYGGGIQKYTNSTTTGWELAYIITNGCTKGNGAYGVAVDWSAADPVIYATTATSNSNRVIRIVDNAGSLSTAETIYTPASDFYYLRGLAFAPTQPAGPSCTPPTIDSDPTPQIVTVSGPAAFMVGASGTALTYQWQKNGAAISDGGTITGATTPVITLNGVAVMDSGSSWRCVVTSSGACSNTSQAATLTVYTPFQTWQIFYFGSTNAANAAANVDVTGTGQNNLFKFVAGLDPTNAASVFVVSARSVSNKIDVAFHPIASGRVYTPLFSTNLVTWSPLTTFTGPLTKGNQVTLTDTNAAVLKKFYRINISLP